MTTYESQRCLLFIFYLYMPSAVLLHLCVDPFQHIFYTVAHVRTHAPAAAALLCVSFCFVIKTHHFSFSLIGAYCDISLALPLSGHSSFNGRRRKKLTIFSKELIITFTKTGFMLLRNSFPSV